NLWAAGCCHGKNSFWSVSDSFIADWKQGPNSVSKLMGLSSISFLRSSGIEKKRRSQMICQTSMQLEHTAQAAQRFRMVSGNEGQAAVKPACSSWLKYQGEAWWYRWKTSISETPHFSHCRIGGNMGAFNLPGSAGDTDRYAMTAGK
ncbi:hypothetical protein GOODEAATRI_029593, partial [Goodea atripinnis]